MSQAAKNATVKQMNDEVAASDIRKDPSLDQGLATSQTDIADAKLSTAPGKAGSRVLSVGSSQGSSNNAAHRFAREVSETVTGKLREMKWCVLAMITNVALFVFIRYADLGLVVGISHDISSIWETIGTFEGFLQ